MFTTKIAQQPELHIIRTLASQIWEPTYKDILPVQQLDFMFEMMYSLENLEKQLTQLHHTFFIFYDNDNPVGYLSIEQKSDTIFNLQKIYALPSMQGKGLGKFMFNRAIEHTSELNKMRPYTIELYVNRHNKAVDFYKHLGFIIADERDFHIGNDFYMNDYIMEYTVII